MGIVQEITNDQYFIDRQNESIDRINDLITLVSGELLNIQERSGEGGKTSKIIHTILDSLKELSDIETLELRKLTKELLQ